MAASDSADLTLVADLVTANRILYHQGVLDGFGHVSARHDAHPGCFLIARSMAPGLVTAADITLCDFDGNVLDPLGRRAYVERFIHGSIYARRPDVHAVVHSHSPAMIPFGVTASALKPICHMSGFLGTSTPIFEIREHAGSATDLLIRSRELGEALARSLGEATVALMRGHGSVVVGRSIRQVVYRAIYAEANARLQTEAMRLGEITFLTEAEAANTAAMNDQHLDRPWALWKERAECGLARQDDSP